jgi:hypothetical protein
VKLTKPTSLVPPLPPLLPLGSRDRRFRTLQGVPGMLAGRRPPEVLRMEDTEPLELCRVWPG